MNKKILMITVLVTLLIVLLIGCSELNNETDKISDESKIKKQMNKWIEGWETKNTDSFNEIMVSSGINFTLSNELEKRI